MAREQVIQIPVGRGAATGIDPSLSQRLQTAVGVVYRPGDPAAHKHPGRTAFNAAALAAEPVDDVIFINSRLFAFVGNDIYKLTTNTGVATSVGSFDNTPQAVDMTTLDDLAYVVTGFQSTTTPPGSGITSPFGAYQIRSNGTTLVRLGLYTQFNAPGAALGAAGFVNGPVYYWVTEYDSTNAVESALTADLPPTVGMSPVAQRVDITRPTIVNPSADKWRIYRTIDGGTFPIGWLVAELPIATASYTDNTADADLVLNDEYRIVTINDIPESMDVDPQTLALTSIASFQGSLIATTNVGGDFAWTPAGEPHSWPASYILSFPTKYAGSSICVRTCGDVAYVAFTRELFMVNYLPSESDSIFDRGLCVEKVANYGTPSRTGMCEFTGWGGQPILFVASLQGPILVAGKMVDRAVKAIDWNTLMDFDTGSPGTWKCVDRPEKQRVEMFYENDGVWSCLHFYYDTERITSEARPLPEMAWTGPHPVPGRGTNGYGSSFQDKAWTAGATAATGQVWLEDSGTVDSALLTDSDGTIPFTLRTQRIYPAGTTGEAKCDRVFISKFGDGAQDYTLSLTRWREKHGEVQHRSTDNIVISGTYDGINSHTLNDSVQGFDIEVSADGNTAMAPINNISVVLKDVHEGIKTVTV